MTKKKTEFDKLFMNCNKMQFYKAKRILVNREELSLRNYNWDIPLDLREISLKSINNFRTETFIGLGEWRNTKKKFICIAQNKELIYLQPEIVKIMYNSIKTSPKETKANTPRGNN